MSYENLLVERSEATVVITMNRPKALNALNAATIRIVTTGLAILKLVVLGPTILNVTRINKGDLAKASDPFAPYLSILTAKRQWMTDHDKVRSSPVRASSSLPLLLGATLDKGRHQAWLPVEKDDQMWVQVEENPYLRSRWKTETRS